MDLSLSQHQQMLQATARDFVRREAPKELLVAFEREGAYFSSDLWNRVAGLGWLGSFIPSEYGGEGASLLDVAVIHEELGRGPVPGPFFESSVLCASLILSTGSEDQKQRLPPEIAPGRVVATLAVIDPSPRWGAESVTTAAEPRGSGFVLHGVTPFVHYGAIAHTYLVAARTEARVNGSTSGISLFLVDRQTPGVSVRDLPEGTITGFAEVALDGVEVQRTALLGEPGHGWAALEGAMQRALPVLGAFQVGGMQMVTEAAVEYSQTRIVFAQPIGRFQRVQDRIIDAVSYRDAARWGTYEAIWKLETGRPAASSIHLAKALASEGYYEASNLCAEVFAGIGVEAGTGLNAHIRMSRGLYSYLGDPRYHRRQMVDAYLV